MRITKLSIKKYKNLENFEWILNPDYPVAVIVGKNGSGKTNLLEAIITIFQDSQLYDHESKTKSLPKFEFEIEYLNLDDTINIKNDGTLKITKNGENVPLSQLENFRQDISQGEDVLPKSIFVYYAGNTTRLAELTDKSISAYKQTLIDIANNKIERQSSPKQPLFYYDLLHHRAVFLTLMLSSLKNIQDDFLKDDLGIENLVSVNVTVSRPNWKRGSSKEVLADIESFWDAPIYLKRILEVFRGIAELEIQADSKETVFDIFGDVLKTEFAEFGNETDFFQQLSNLILADYLTDVKIYFKKDGEILEFNDLSEGEWQRIGIRGAMELFQGEETLFLLDEPDTFAHPSWQWEFVPDIEKTVGKDKENKSTQVVFITHSPLVLSSTEKNAFFMEGGQINQFEESFGRDANESLANMDVNSQMEEVVEEFRLYFSLIKDGKGESRRALEEKERLEELYGLNHEKFDTARKLIALYKK